MANRRDLKRNLNYVCSELFAESVVTYLTVKQEDVEQIDAILASIVKIQKDFTSRVMHPEPGMKASKYYRALKEDFNKQVIEIIDNIQALT